MHLQPLKMAPLTRQRQKSGGLMISSRSQLPSNSHRPWDGISSRRSGSPNQTLESKHQRHGRKSEFQQPLVRHSFTCVARNQNTCPCVDYGPALRGCCSIIDYFFNRDRCRCDECKEGWSGSDGFGVPLRFHFTKRLRIGVLVICLIMFPEAASRCWRCWKMWLEREPLKLYVKLRLSTYVSNMPGRHNAGLVHLSIKQPHLLAGTDWIRPVIHARIYLLSDLSYSSAQNYPQLESRNWQWFYTGTPHGILSNSMIETTEAASSSNSADVVFTVCLMARSRFPAMYATCRCLPVLIEALHLMPLKKSK